MEKASLLTKGIELQAADANPKDKKKPLVLPNYYSLPESGAF